MEVIDLYDRNRQLLNETAVRGEKLPKGRYRLVVHICLFNEKDEMLIQQRQTTQKHFPNMWDLTVGGQVSAGETSWQGIQRELSEELGIGDKYDLRNVGKKIHGVHDVIDYESAA